MKTSGMKTMEYTIDEITEITIGFGLDFYSIRYKICPSDIIYTFSAYGMPNSFNHRSFGKENGLMNKKEAAIVT